MINAHNMIQKINAKTNVLTWFEIPVKNMERAQTFYETILDIKMETMDNQKEETVFFPRLPDTIMAQSGILSGALVKSERLKPSVNGPLVYLNAYPSIDAVIARIKQAGGEIIAKKTKIPAGFIAVFHDTEGNRLALHAEE
jgi:predicted enzyme related to lactoylglutathione lyase